MVCESMESCTQEHKLYNLVTKIGQSNTTKRSICLLTLFLLRLGTLRSINTTRIINFSVSHNSL